MNSRDKDVKEVLLKHFPNLDNLYYLTEENLSEVLSEAWERGRESKLQDNGRMKLTEDKVREIREILEKGYLGVRAVARAYEIAPRTVRDLRDRKTWKYVE